MEEDGFWVNLRGWCNWWFKRGRHRYMWVMVWF